MSRVVESKDTHVVSPADLEAVDPAVRGHYPGCLLRVASDRSDEMKRHETDRSGVRIDRDPPTHMIPEDLPQLRRAASK